MLLNPFPSFDPTPSGLERLYARLLLVMLVPLAALHAFLLCVGAATPLAFAFEAGIALLAWRLLVRAGRATSAGIARAAPTEFIVWGIGILGVATAFETGGVGSPQIVLVVLTVVFSGLLLDTNALIRTTAVVAFVYAFFTLLLPDGLTLAVVDAQEGGRFFAGSRVPITDLAALVQNAVYLGLAAFAAHAAKDRLRAQWAGLERRAKRDALTRLPNRNGFREDVLRGLARPVAADWPLAVLMLDLDHFKRINDRFGHGVGDDVLRRTGEILRETIGPTDHVGRHGGEEFTVAAMAADAHYGMDLADRIVRAFRAHEWQTIRPELRVTVSVGVAIVSPTAIRGVDPNLVLNRALERADAALYTAKEGGRDRYHVGSEHHVTAPTTPPTKTIPLRNPLDARTTGSGPSV